MRTIEQALFDHELITLRVIGEWWELDLTGADKAGCVRALAETLSQIDLATEINYMEPGEADTLLALAGANGRIPVATFHREHGEVRQMGPARLEREEPWFEPENPAESLWYRGLLYRGFDEAGDELAEFYYLPDELLARLPRPDQPAAPRHTHALQPAPSPPAAATGEAPSEAVDDLTTLLITAQREGVHTDNLTPLHPFLLDTNEARNILLLHLALEMQLLRQTKEGLRPSRAAIGWLQRGREEQLHALANAWRESEWNDLCHTPGLICEGSGWSNDPRAARQALLAALPAGTTWYRLDDLVTHIHETNPNFQRPDGNYDIWYVRDIASDTYVTGFENWHLVEGRLLRFLVTGPLVWLGMAQAEVESGHFRLTERGASWLAGQKPAGPGVRVPLVVQTDGSLLVPHNADRYQRFQAGRVAEPRPLEPGRPYEYQLTPRSLQQARDQGIEPERVLEFLGNASGRPVPPSIRRAIERWAERGLEGQLEPAVILRVRDAEILDTLQANARTRPFLGQRLGDLAAVIRQEDWREFQRVTAQLGLFLDIVEA